MYYRLKKWYPSLPKDWEEGMEVGQGDRRDGTYSPCNSKYEKGGLILLTKGQVENNPRFWEKIVPKEFLIKTTDGLELIAGDRYYVPKVEGKLRRLAGSEIMFHVEPNMPEDDIKRFAKKENAQTYIESNIELFSAKDVHELLKKYSRMMVDSSIYLELSKMVKEKLQN